MREAMRNGRPTQIDVFKGVSPFTIAAAHIAAVKSHNAVTLTWNRARGSFGNLVSGPASFLTYRGSIPFSSGPAAVLIAGVASSESRGSVASKLYRAWREAIRDGSLDSKSCWPLDQRKALVQRLGNDCEMLMGNVQNSIVKVLVGASRRRM
jgi:hypothetical protein